MLDVAVSHYPRQGLVRSIPGTSWLGTGILGAEEGASLLSSAEYFILNDIMKEEKKTAEEICRKVSLLLLKMGGTCAPNSH